MKWLSLIIFLLIGCEQRPLPLRQSDYQEATPGNGIWLAIRTGVSGKLVRLDKEKLTPTKLETSHILSDVVLLPDLNDHLFMLSRIGSDSLQLLQGTSAKLVTETALPLGDLSDKYPVPFNAQFALRDQKNRVWLIGQNSNTIFVYSSDLSHIKTEINLDKLNSDFTILKDGHDHYLEPALLITPNNNEMIVFLQKLRRYYDGGWDWVPTPTSTMVVINTNDFTIRTIKEIPVSNPIKAFLNTSNDWPTITVIGAGSMNDYPIGGSKIIIGSKNYTIQKQENYPFKILDANNNSQNELAIIAWYKDLEYSCIILNGEETICEKAEQGYIFNKILLDNTHTYVSRISAGSSSLLMINNNTDNITSIPMMGLIESMVFGQ